MAYFPLPQGAPQIPDAFPCAHCGGVPELRDIRQDVLGRYRVNCSNCGADGPPGDNRADAMYRWNGRAI